MSPVLDDTALEYADKALKEKDWQPISDRNKVLSSAGMAIVPLLTNLILKKKIGLDLVPKTVVMGAMGYAIPSVINDAIKKKEEERREFLKNEFARISSNPLSKQASALPSIGAGIAKAIKYTGQGVKDLGRGLLMPIRGNATVGQTALSVGSKALLGYGAYKTGKAVMKDAHQPNYVDYLRNQVLAGNVKPAELSQRDLGAVRNLGMY